MVTGSIDVDLPQFVPCDQPSQGVAATRSDTQRKRRARWLDPGLPQGSDICQVQFRPALHHENRLPSL